MENSIINKINAIIMSNDSIDSENITLLKYLEVVNKINQEIRKIVKDTLKKLNNKLSNNIAFFDYEIKGIELNKNLILNVAHQFTTKNITISLSDLSIHTDIKNKENLFNLIKDDIKKLIVSLKDYEYLNKIMIKAKDKDININIDSKEIEIFMHKSPNWITMGKAFSLSYDFKLNKYIYNIDSIGLLANIKNNENLLFSELSFPRKLLPIELNNKIAEFDNEITKKTSPNAVTKFFNMLKKLMKK